MGNFIKKKANIGRNLNMFLVQIHYRNQCSMYKSGSNDRLQKLPSDNNQNLFKKKIIIKLFEIKL